MGHRSGRIPLLHLSVADVFDIEVSSKGNDI